MHELPTSKDQWFIVSACLNHMTPRADIFITKEPFTNASGVITGDNTKLEIKGRGDVMMGEANGGIKHLANILLVPKLCKNLMSVGQLVDQGYDVVFSRNGCEVLKKENGSVVASGKKSW